MPSKMLIDATHPEETRVVVLRGNRVEEFDFESAHRQQLRGNIYLAKVTRVEPSLQAAFIDYGGNRHGFLAFSEIHPDYYQIPVADRQALIDEERRAHRAADDEDERRARRHQQRASASREDTVKSRASENGESAEAEPETQFVEDAETPSSEFSGDVGDPTMASSNPELAETLEHQGAVLYEPSGEAEADTSVKSIALESIGAEGASEPAGSEGEQENGGDSVNSALGEIEEVDTDETEETVESVGGSDALEDMPDRAARPRRQYKIQEVIKRRQIMLVQVVKEERGTKGAALTTYLSLAGRYSVLMPNTARGGGISRKITNAQDRKRLKEVAHELEVPEGMGVILRTAGANRTKTEIKRDFEYLLRLWETVRDLTLQSTAPKLVYEEGSLIKRAIRDLYSKEIDEILTAGDEAWKEAKDFMRMLMPSHAKNVKQYRDTQPIFTRFGIESQLDAMFSPVVQLRSGGYIVLNQTEALVAIDVNSGRATREHHIEDTALKTNLEASEEVSRQLRLRDLAGLIVIDFIDMDEKRNNRAVERRLKECLRNDRARIQVGRISHFGLLEMSRQRIRSSVLESSTEKCPHCGGTGHVRSVASVALQLVRALEETLLKGATHNLIVRTRSSVALYVLNQKRAHLRELEERFRIMLAIQADETVGGALPYTIERGEQVHSLEAAKALVVQPMTVTPVEDEEEEEEETADLDAEAQDETLDAETETEETETDEDGVRGDAEREDGTGQRRRRRRRRRGRRDTEEQEQPEPALETASEGEESEEEEPAETAASVDDAGDGSDTRRDGRRRRRGRRGGRRRERDDQPFDPASPAVESELSSAVADFDAGPPAAFASESEPAHEQRSASPVAAQDAQEVEARTVEPPRPALEPPQPAPEPTRRRSTVREPAPFLAAVPTDDAAPTPLPRPAERESTPKTVETQNAESESPKSGWWKRRLFGGN